MGKFVVKKSVKGDFYFNLKAGNGETILSSEMYTSRAACDNGIDSVKKNALEDKRYERKISSNGKFFFNLKASNGQVIGNSELYESEKSRDNGIESVKKNAPEAKVEEDL